MIKTQPTTVLKAGKMSAIAEGFTEMTALIFMKTP